MSAVTKNNKNNPNLINGLITGIYLLSITACSVNNPTLPRSPNIDYKKAALLNVELGRNYLAQGYTERAKKKFLHALDLMPSLAESHSGMGYFWEVVGEDREAEKYYKKSINLGKGNGLFYNQYAVFLCERNRYKEAERNFTLAIKDKTYTETAEIYNNAGLCALKYNNQEQAAQYLIKSLHHNPRRTNVLLDLAKVLLAQNKLTHAEHYLTKFHEANHKPTPAYLWLSIKVANKLGKTDQVASKGLLLKNLFPNSEEYALYKKEYQ